MAADDQWFHVHIPKTAGTSLNRMLSEALGNEFAAHHHLDTKAAPRVAASHLPLLHARRKWPERRIVTILRDPGSRLHSVMQHFSGRRTIPRYHRHGHIIAAMYQGSMEVDPFLLDHPLMCQQCDNVMVRYLSSAGAYDKAPRHISPRP